MEFKDVVYGRRSVRKFTNQKIDRKVLEEIIDAGLYAPSGVNLQPWYFVVIDSDEQLKEFKADISSEIAKRNHAHLEERFADHPDVVQSVTSFITNLGGAQTIILAFRDKPDYTWALQDEGVVQSIAAAMENILLSAYDHGIYGCWMTSPAQAGMCEVLRDKYAPGHGVMVCMAVLGYPEDGAVGKAPKRKENKVKFI